MNSVYTYTSPSNYLRDKFEEKKSINSAFSLRSWAMVLGMKSHGTLHAMLKGERNIPKKYVPLLINSLKLESKESKYFELLIDYSRAKSDQEKSFHLEKLNKLKPQEFRSTDSYVDYKFLTNPIHIILSEMSQLKNFKNTLSWLKARLRPHASLSEIEETMKKLLELKILEETDGVFKKNTKHLYIASKIPSSYIQQYHKEMSKIAIDQITKQDVDEREYNAVSFNIKKENLAKIKEAINEFSDQLIQTYEADFGEGDETYHLNVQFFSLSK